MFQAAPKKSASFVSFKGRELDFKRLENDREYPQMINKKSGNIKAQIGERPDGDLQIKDFYWKGATLACTTAVKMANRYSLEILDPQEWNSQKNREKTPAESEERNSVIQTDIERSLWAIVDQLRQQVERSQKENADLKINCQTLKAENDRLRSSFNVSQAWNSDSTMNFEETKRKTNFIEDPPKMEKAIHSLKNMINVIQENRQAPSISNPQRENNQDEETERGVKDLRSTDRFFAFGKANLDQNLYVKEIPHPFSPQIDLMNLSS